MAASSSTDARASSSAERFNLLRQLGSGGAPIWAALERLPDGATRLVVIERDSPAGAASEHALVQSLSDARGLMALEHPNVVRVREVLVRGRDATVVSDFVDGVRWSELALGSQRPSLELSVRVLVDVLSGLSAIHNLRDAKRQPLKIVHGELTPACVIVGMDGVARVVGAHRIRGAKAKPTAAASAYLAPEILLADDAADARADVYSVGVLLWEVLSGRPLFPSPQASAIATQVLGGAVPRATVPESCPWAQPLADAAARALAADPRKRFGSAAAFAAELRRVVGAKLAPPARVAGLLRATHGDRIRARREALERGERTRDLGSAVESRNERPSPPESSLDGSIDIPIDFEEASEVPSVPVPVPVPVPVLARPPPPPSRRAPPRREPPPIFVPATTQTPMPQLVVPAAPALPVDPGAPATAAESIQPDPIPKWRWARVALVGAPALATASMLAWWIASRSAEPAVAHPSRPSAAVLTAAPTQEVSAAVVPPRAAQEPHVEENSPTPVELPASVLAPSLPLPALSPAAPSPRVPARSKYEPEGI